MAKFKPYHGKDKYHFRLYQKLRHPFLVTKVDYENKLICGYVMTHKPFINRAVHKLINNPNMNDDRFSYLQTYLIIDTFSEFSNPYSNWHLSIEDLEYIEKLEKKLGQVLRNS